MQTATETLISRLIVTVCSLALYFSAFQCGPPESGIVYQIQTALNLGNTSLNYSREECSWRKGNDEDTCPDPDVRFILYTSDNKTGAQVDLTTADWLRTSTWDPFNDNVILVHGYAGGDGQFPLFILRDAYIQHGGYNVFVVDWGALSKLPCYPAAVHNLKPAARCTAQLFTFIRDMGVSERKLTCVGHSLGAHLCGLVGNYLQFRLHRVIGLDPARPLIRNQLKLRPGSAHVVEVLHTNAGTYGEGGKLGKVDVCLNGGKIQPMCENKTNAALCSHLMSVCYMAASLDMSTSYQATPCARRCPTTRPNHRLGSPVLIGEHLPDSAAGYYCMSNTVLPYCPTAPDRPGHPWCCLNQKLNNEEQIAPPLDSKALQVDSDESLYRVVY